MDNAEIAGQDAAICYVQEKCAGLNCANFNCRFYDDTDTYEQKCMAGDSDDNPFLPECDKYIPENFGG